MAVRVWGMCQTWHPSQTSRSESDSAFMVQVFAVLSHGLLQKQLVVFVQLVPSTSSWCCSCWLLFFSRSFRGSLFRNFLVLCFGLLSIASASSQGSTCSWQQGMIMVSVPQKNKSASVHCFCATFKLTWNSHLSGHMENQVQELKFISKAMPVNQTKLPCHEFLLAEAWDASLLLVEPPIQFFCWFSQLKCWKKQQKNRE